jgi:hypothetical protein
MTFKVVTTTIDQHNQQAIVTAEDQPLPPIGTGNVGQPKIVTIQFPFTPPASGATEATEATEVIQAAKAVLQQALNDLGGATSR